YGKVVLPFTLLRRLDCVLAPTKEKVLAECEKRKAIGIDPGVFLEQVSGLKFYHTSKFNCTAQLADSNHIKGHLADYIIQKRLDLLGGERLDVLTGHTRFGQTVEWRGVD